MGVLLSQPPLQGLVSNLRVSVQEKGRVKAPGASLSGAPSHLDSAHQPPNRVIHLVSQNDLPFKTPSIEILESSLIHW